MTSHLRRGIWESAYGNAKWVVAGLSGKVRRSRLDTPTAWITHSSPTAEQINGGYVRAGWTSQADWTSTVFVEGSESTFSLTEFGGGLVAETTFEMFVSTDGITWIEVPQPTYSGRGGFAHDGLYVHIGVTTSTNNYRYIYSSTDLTTWTTVRALTTTDTPYGVIYVNDRWVIGDDESFYHSTDLVTWGSITQMTGLTGWAGNAQSLVYATGIWVVADWLCYHTSTDLITWTTASLPTASLISPPLYASGRWLLSDEFAMRTSTDLVTWTTNNLLPELYVRNYQIDGGVGWADDGSYLAYTNDADYNLTFYKSTDTVTWVSKAVPVPRTHVTTHAIRRNGVWYFGGQNHDPSYQPTVWREYEETVTVTVPTQYFIAGDTNRLYAVDESLSVWTTIVAITDTPYETEALGKDLYGYGLSTWVDDAYDWRVFGEHGVMYGQPSTFTTTTRMKPIYRRGPLTMWTTVVSGITPYTSSAYEDVTYANGTWVIPTHAGKVVTSTDAVTWVTRATAFTTIINMVAYGNGLWVAVGYLGMIQTSTDLITWTTRTSYMVNTQVKSVTYGNGLWVAVGYGSSIRKSTDGVTWATVTHTFTTSSLVSVAYGNGIWMVGGNQVRSSTDLVTWVTGNFNWQSGGDWALSLIWASRYNTWVAICDDSGDARKSTDGVTWTTVLNYEDGYGGYALTYDGKDLFVYTNYHGVVWMSGITEFSTDQDSYRPPIYMSTFGSIGYDGNKTWVLASHEDARLAVSTDGPWTSTITAYTKFTVGSDNVIRPNIHDANGGSYYPVDYIDDHVADEFPLVYQKWSRQFNRIGSYTGSGTLLTYSNGRWLIRDPYNSGTSRYVGASTDLVTWTTYGINALLTWSTSAWPTGMGYDGSKYVLSTQKGIIFSSTDLVTWTTRDYWTTDVNEVVYANSIWVATGYVGTIKSSTDAITWTTRASVGATTIFYDVNYLPTIGFYAYGHSVSWYKSTDGITWTSSTIPTGMTRDFRLRNNGATVFAYYYKNIWKSTDSGSTWTSVLTGEKNPSSIVMLEYNPLGYWVLVDDTGECSISTDGNTWSFIGRTGPFADLGYYDNPLGAQGGNQTVLRSSSHNVTYGTPFAVYDHTYYSERNQVVVGDIYTSSDPLNSAWIQLTSDGILWAMNDSTRNWDRRPLVSGGNPPQYMNVLARASTTGTKYIAAGNAGLIYKSTDTVTWTSQTITSGNITAVAYSATYGLWAMADSTGIFKTSTDAVTWTTRDTTFGTGPIKTIMPNRV